MRVSAIVIISTVLGTSGVSAAAELPVTYLVEA